jgi:hypothetical protein
MELGCARGRRERGEGRGENGEGRRKGAGWLGWRLEA